MAVLDSCGWVEAMEKKLHEGELESGILRGLERACAWSEVPLAGLRAEHCKLRASAIQGLQDSGGSLCAPTLAIDLWRCDVDAVQWEMECLTICFAPRGLSLSVLIDL